MNIAAPTNCLQQCPGPIQGSRFPHAVARSQRGWERKPHFAAGYRRREADALDGHQHEVVRIDITTGGDPDRFDPTQRYQHRVAVVQHRTPVPGLPALIGGIGLGRAEG